MKTVVELNGDKGKGSENNHSYNDHPAVGNHVRAQQFVYHFETN